MSFRRRRSVTGIHDDREHTTFASKLLDNEFSRRGSSKRAACRCAESSNASTKAVQANVENDSFQQAFTKTKKKKKKRGFLYLRGLDATNVMLGRVDIGINALDVRVRMMTENMLIRLSWRQRAFINETQTRYLFSLTQTKEEAPLRKSCKCIQICQTSGDFVTVK
jgi:hypothetical protein